MSNLYRFSVACMFFVTTTSSLHAMNMDSIKEKWNTFQQHRAEKHARDEVQRHRRALEKKLHDAAECGNRREVANVLAFRPRVNVNVTGDDYWAGIRGLITGVYYWDGRTPLMKTRDVGVVKLLLDAGGNVNAVDCMNRTVPVIMMENKVDPLAIKMVLDSDKVMTDKKDYRGEDFYDCAVKTENDFFVAYAYNLYKKKNMRPVITFFKKKRPVADGFLCTQGCEIIREYLFQDTMQFVQEKVSAYQEKEKIRIKEEEKRERERREEQESAKRAGSDKYEIRYEGIEGMSAVRYEKRYEGTEGLREVWVKDDRLVGSYY